MNNFLSLLFAVLSVSLAAQCDNDRYKTQIFENFSLTSDIVYGSNYDHLGIMQNLHLDMYEPTGDLEEERAVILIAHGGFFIAGEKTGDDVVPFAQDFAKMGYVVCSIQYRLGMEADPFLPSEQTATEAVIRGYHDEKAAIRYLRKTIAEEGNPYRLSNDLFFSAGVSAGGFITVHNMYLDELDEIPVLVDTTKLGLGGGLEGLSGNPGYSSDLIAGVNIAGAIGDTTWIDANEEPLISFHGDEDGTVPYDIGTIGLLGFELGTAMGSFPIHEKLNELGIENCFETQENEDHVPHNGNALIYDTLVVKARNFLAKYICDIDLTCEYEQISVGLNDLQNLEAKIYPNPSNGAVRIDIPYAHWNINVLDVSGRIVYAQNDNNTDYFNLNKDQIGEGVFILNMSSELGTMSSKVVFY